MIIVFGGRSFGGTPVAFRNDYCFTCAMPRMSYQIRAFWYLHLFWLPVMPLGFYKTWYCQSCGERPHQRTRTSPKVMRLLVVAVIVLAGFIVWSSPVAEEARWLTWALRIAMPLAFVPAFVIALRTPPDQRLATILLESVGSSTLAFLSPNELGGPHRLSELKMGWELRKKRLLGEPPLPKLAKLPKLPKLHKLPKVPKILRPPKPEAPPGHEYYWRDE